MTTKDDIHTEEQLPEDDFVSAKELLPYSKFTEQMEALKETSNHIADASTKEGYEKAKRIHLDFRKIENAIDKERKSQKKYWSDGAKAVDKMGNGIAGEVSDLRQPHTEAYQKVDADNKAREVARIAGLENRLDYIVNMPFNLGYSSSDEVKLAMEEMQAEECLGFDEYADKALEARSKTRNLLEDIYNSKIMQEKDAADLEELKAKQAKQDELDRQAAAVKSATEKVERDKQDAIREKQDAIAAKEKYEEINRNLKAKAEQDAKDAEIAATKAAEKARLDEVARQEAVKAEDARQEAARLADKSHRKNFNQQAIIDLQAFAGISQEQAEATLTAIARKQISNITINY